MRGRKQSVAIILAEKRKGKLRPKAKLPSMGLAGSMRTMRAKGAFGKATSTKLY